MALGPYIANTRVVEPRGDISDVIANIDIDVTPIFSTFRHEAAQDTKVQVITDSLASASLTNYHGWDENAPAASDTTRAIVYNYMQRFLVTAEVSTVQQAVAQYGMGKELLYQEVKKLREFKRDIEKTLVSDMAKQEMTAANGNVGKMDGITTIISTNTSASFSQANFDTLMAACVGYGGNPTVAYMDSTKKIAVGAWTTNPTRFTTDVKRLEQEVAVYHSDLGSDVAILWHHLVPGDVTTGAHFLCLDSDTWVIKELIPPHRTELPDNGSGPSTMIEAVLSILCRAEKANIEFTA